MNLIESIILGFIQGVAEFLPVSSSGHLAIFKTLFGLEEVGLAFDLMLHLGTLVAVFIVYWSDIWELIKEGFAIIADCGRNTARFCSNRFKGGSHEYINIVSTAYRKFVMLVIVSTIPTGILGLVFKKVFNLDHPSLIIPGIALLITGLMLSIVDDIPNGGKKPENTTYRNAAVIGIAQGVATLPGISRSGTTLTVGLLNGLDRSFAVKYSFIMSIPAILGANILEIKDMFEPANRITSGEFINYLVGTVVAAVVGYVCIKTMLVIVRNKKMKYFSYYCFAMGAVAITAYFIK